MQLSLFSRDVIAMSTAIALSHDMFDATLMLGVCDKIVPGMLIGALAFGHLPTIFVPGGPDDLRTAQRREVPGPAALRREQGRPRRTPRRRGSVLPRQRHLHLLRHRQLQSAADGGDGPAPARIQLRQPRHTTAHRADRRSRPSGHRNHRSGGRLHPGRGDDRRDARSSTAASRCSRPAAQPTTPCTWSPSPRPPESR